MGNTLALKGDEGRDWLRYAPGSCQSSFDPEISEWENLYRIMPVCLRKTGGTETSKYLEEKKSIEISGVVASETETV